MSLVAERIKAHFDAKEIRYDYYEPSESRNEAIRVSFGAKNKDSISLLLFIDKDGNSINVKSFSVAKVPENKLMDMYVCLNDLNNQYRWVKFYVDSDNEVTVSGDAIVDEASAGEECLEIVIRYIGIIDDVYPNIMKTLWA